MIDRDEKCIIFYYRTYQPPIEHDYVLLSRKRMSNTWSHKNCLKSNCVHRTDAGTHGIRSLLCSSDDNKTGSKTLSSSQTQRLFCHGAVKDKARFSPIHYQWHHRYFYFCNDDIKLYCPQKMER